MKRVAFYGFIEDSLQDFAAYAKKHPDAEVWGFNASQRLADWSYPRYSRWYELHAIPKLAEDLPWLAKADCPVVMQQVHPDVPRSIAYPLDAAKRLLFYPYFTNTITFMLAHAILDGFEEIALFGIDMAIRMGDGPSGLSEQRPSVEYALGIARGRGISICIPDSCDLLKTNVLYGYEEHVDSLRTRMRRRREALERGMSYHENSAASYRGALMELDGDLARWLTSEDEKT